MNKFRQKLDRFFQGRYGMDQLGKTVLIGSSVVYIIGALLRKSLLLSLAMIGFLWQFYRMMSKQYFDRSEENRRYNRYVKLWKLQYQERHTSRIFMCKSCGRLIRVPKGKGKIEVTCTACGHKKIHRT